MNESAEFVEFSIDVYVPLTIGFYILATKPKVSPDFLF